MIRRLYKLDHLYGLLLTFGLALVIEGLFRNYYGSSGMPYDIPSGAAGGDRSRVHVPADLSRLGGGGGAGRVPRHLGDDREDVSRRQAARSHRKPRAGARLRVNVPRLITMTYGGGVALAAFAGVLAAPIYSVNPDMGDNFINTVFAIVVIGGMGSILGSIVTGFGLGVIEGLTKVFYPQASATVIFLVMVIVLLFMPRGLFGKTA